MWMLYILLTILTKMEAREHGTFIYDTDYRLSASITRQIIISHFVNLLTFLGLLVKISRKGDPVLSHQLAEKKGCLPFQFKLNEVFERVTWHGFISFFLAILLCNLLRNELLHVSYALFHRNHAFLQRLAQGW